MSFKYSIIFCVVASLIETIAASGIASPENEANKNFLNFMVRSSGLMQNNPARSSECFSYYIPLIDSIAKTYEQNHNSCLQKSSEGRISAENATLDQRNDLAFTVNNSCALLSSCSNIASAAGVLECYVTGGSENSVTMYAMNVNASQYLSDLEEQFRLLDVHEYKCTNDSKRIYEKDSAAAYSDFNNCMLGIGEIPTTTQTTVTTKSTQNPQDAEYMEDPAEDLEIPEDSPESRRIIEIHASPQIALLQKKFGLNINRNKY